MSQDSASEERITLHNIFQGMDIEEMQEHAQNFRLFLTALTDNTPINGKNAAIYLQEQLWKAASRDKYTFAIPPNGLTPFEFALDTGTEIAGENPLIYLHKQYSAAITGAEKAKYKVPQELPISASVAKSLTLVSPDQYVLHNFDKLSKATSGAKRVQIDDGVLKYFYGLYQNGKYSSEDFLKLLDLSIAQGHEVNCSKFINIKDDVIVNPEFLIHFHKQYEAWNGGFKSNPCKINGDIPFEWAHSQKLNIGKLPVAMHFYNSNILVDEQNVFATLVESYELEDEDQGRKRYECDGLSPQEYIIQHPDILIDGQPGIIWLIANNTRISSKDAIEYAIEKKIEIGSILILKYCIDNNIPINSEPPAIWAQRKLKLGGKPDIYCIDKVEPIEYAVLKMLKEGKKDEALDLFRAAVKSGINFKGTEILKILEAESNKSHDKLSYAIDREKQDKVLQSHPIGGAGAKLPSPMTEALAYNNIVIAPSAIIEHFKESPTETNSAFVARLVKEERMDVLEWIAKNNPKFLLDNCDKSSLIENTDVVFYLQSVHKDLTDNIRKQEEMVATGRPVQAADVAALRGQLHKAELEYNKAVGAFIKTQHKNLIDNTEKLLSGLAEQEEIISTKIKAFETDNLEKLAKLEVLEQHVEKEHGLGESIDLTKRTIFKKLEDHLSQLEKESDGMRILIKSTQLNLANAMKIGNTKLSSILKTDLEKIEKIAKQQGVKMDSIRKLISNATDDIENITATKQFNYIPGMTEAMEHLGRLEKNLAAVRETSDKENHQGQINSLRASIIANDVEIAKLNSKQKKEIIDEMQGLQQVQLGFMESSEENAKKQPNCLKLKGKIEELRRRISESGEGRRENLEYAYQQAEGMLQAFGGMSPARYLLNEALAKGNEVEVSWKLLAAKEMSVPEFLSVMGIDVENLKKNNKPSDRAKESLKAIIQFLKECPIEEAQNYLDALKTTIKDYPNRPGAPTPEDKPSYKLEQNINKNLSQLEKQAEKAVKDRLTIKTPTFVDRLLGRKSGQEASIQK